MTEKFGVGTRTVSRAGNFALLVVFALGFADRPVTDECQQLPESPWLAAIMTEISDNVWPFVTGVTGLVLGGLFLLIFRGPLSDFIREITCIELPGGKIERNPRGDSGRSGVDP